MIVGPLSAKCVTQLVVAAVLVGATGMAAAQTPVAPSAKRAKVAHVLPRRPLPIEIPQEFAPPQEAYASLPDEAAAAAPAAPSPCDQQLASVATFQALPVLVGPGECGATDAVLLQAIVLRDQSKVAVEPPATLRCTMAQAVVQWVRDDVAPQASALGAPLRTLDDADSYDCRGRNRVRGATLSEHGRANALDVHDFKLTDGRTIALTDIHVARDFRDAIKASVCARFATVLGPGSDGAHEEHIHLDLAERRNNYKICEWDVRVPPPPPPPVEAQAPAPATAEAEQAPAADADTTAAAPAEPSAQPLDAVPLPRPRPSARIAKLLSAPRSTPRRSSFDAVHDGAAQ